MICTGQKFPDFDLPAVVNGKVSHVKLSDYKGKYLGMTSLYIIHIYCL